MRALNYPCLEVIVIDGASTDSTKDVIKGFAQLVTVFVSEKDKGIYNAMNKGIAHVTGDYVVFMNAGDCFADADVLTKVNVADTDVFINCLVEISSIAKVKLITILSICNNSNYY